MARARFPGVDMVGATPHPHSTSVLPFAGTSFGPACEECTKQHQGQHLGTNVLIKADLLSLSCYMLYY